MSSEFNCRLLISKAYKYQFLVCNNTTNKDNNEVMKIFFNKQIQTTILLSYLPHSGGAFQADKSVSDLEFCTQFLTTIDFVVS